MKVLVVSVVTVCAGIALLLFRKSFAAFCVHDQNRVWGFHFGVREERISAVIALILGIGLVVMGLLCLFGVIHVK